VFGREIPDLNPEGEIANGRPVADTGEFQVTCAEEENELRIVGIAELAVHGKTESVPVKTSAAISVGWSQQDTTTEDVHVLDHAARRVAPACWQHRRTARARPGAPLDRVRVANRSGLIRTSHVGKEDHVMSHALSVVEILPTRTNPHWQAVNRIEGSLVGSRPYSTLMANLRERILAELGVKATIAPKVEIRQRVDFLKDYLRSTPAKGYVLGISGGQDSTLTGRLCQLASEELRAEGHEATLVGVRLPYGVQADEHDAQIALGFIQPDRSIAVNVKPSADAVVAEATLGLQELLGDEPKLRDFVRGNVKARARMVIQYSLAGS